MNRNIEITTYYDNELIIEIDYTPEKLTKDNNSPNDPSEIKVKRIFEVVNENNKYEETDKFDKRQIEIICHELCDFNEHKTTLNEKESRTIMNAEKYLSIEEGKMLEFLIRSEAGRAGNSSTKNNMLFLIAKKCKIIGIDQEFIEEMDENFKAKY